MIKTAQRRFILITLSILLVVFSVIFAVMWSISRSNFSREVNNSLSDVERQYKVDNTVKYFKPVMVVEISAYGTETGANFKIIYGENNFTETQTYNIVELSREADTGNDGDTYFMKNRQGAKTMLYVVDMSVEAEMFRSALLKTLILLSASFVALGLIVWGLSAKVFEPIRYILAKQKQFISDASHELKTPVSIISANADVIKTEENAQYIDSIKKQVGRLNFLVSDLLTLARLDEGSVKRITEKFNLSDEVTQTALPFDAVAFEKGKTLDCDIAPNVIYEGAKDDVKKILNILLDNAVKYAADGGKIKVSLKKAGAKCRLSVYNDGSLIHEKDSEKIFERFYRGDLSRSRESGGNGLGLSIAKSIATANKWDISAVSVYGKSMTITLTL